MQNKTEQENLMLKIEAECLVDNSEQIDYPPAALSLGKKYIKTKDGGQMLPIILGSYGNFSFVQSPPKTKKTFFISLLASVYLWRHKRTQDKSMSVAYRHRTGIMA